MSDPSREFMQPPEHLQRLAKSLATISYTEGYKAALIATVVSLPAMQGLSGAEVLRRIGLELKSQIKELE